jgi:predicted transcriptional regulator
MHIKQALKVAVLVRALRNAFNLSQDNLADRTRCSRPTINRMETLGEASPRTDTVDDVLRYFSEQGVEVQVSDEEVLIRFTKTALQNAELGIAQTPQPKKRSYY